MFQQGCSEQAEATKQEAEKREVFAESGEGCLSPEFTQSLLGSTWVLGLGPPRDLADLRNRWKGCGTPAPEMALTYCRNPAPGRG